MLLRGLRSLRTHEDSRNNALCALSGKKADLKANVSFLVITDTDLFVDNLVSLVLCRCPEQNELKCVTQNCSSSPLPKLGRYLGLICLVSGLIKSMFLQG